MAENGGFINYKSREGEPEVVYTGKKRPSMEIMVDVDVSSAIKGLKAVQREAKEATKALKEFEVIVTKNDGELIASVTRENGICKNGYNAVLHEGETNLSKNKLTTPFLLDNFKPLSYEGLDGKTLELGVNNDSDGLTVAGRDIETGVLYVLVSEPKIEN